MQITLSPEVQAALDKYKKNVKRTEVKKEARRQEKKRLRVIQKKRERHLYELPAIRCAAGRWAVEARVLLMEIKHCTGCGARHEEPVGIRYRLRAIAGEHPPGTIWETTDPGVPLPEVMPQQVHKLNGAYVTACQYCFKENTITDEPEIKVEYILRENRKPGETKYIPVTPLQRVEDELNKISLEDL